MKPTQYEFLGVKIQAPSVQNCYPAIQNEEPQIKSLRPKKSHRAGRWDQNEDEIYMKYIVAHEELFTSQTMRRRHKVFDGLAQLLNYKRTSDQCRSHHAKMKKMTKRGTMMEIISYLKEKHRRNKRIYKRMEKMEKKIENKKTIGLEDINPDEGYQIKMNPIKNRLEINIGFKIEQIDDC